MVTNAENTIHTGETDTYRSLLNRRYHVVINTYAYAISGSDKVVLMNLSDPAFLRRK